MDLNSQQPRASNVPRRNAQNSRLCSQRFNWDTYKEEIGSVYRNNTLQVTMRLMEEKYHFKASERSWKMKLKNWGYEKYSTSADRNISVAKTIKRKRDEEIPANVTHHTDRSNRRPEIETPEEVLPAVSHRSLLDMAASNFMGSGTVPAKPLFPSNNEQVSQRDRNTRNLSTNLKQCTATPMTQWDFVNSHDLHKSTILPDTALSETSKHRVGTQIDGAYGASHNPAMLISFTAEETRPIRSTLEDQVRTDKVYQSPQEVAERNFAESESLLRCLLREEERQFGASARKTCQRKYELAKFLHSHKRYEEVETLGRRAIAGFKALGLIGDWLECQCFLGDSLQLQDLDERATPHLLSVIARSLVFNAHNHLRFAMSSLGASHGKSKHHGRFNQAISIIFQMEKILRSLKPFGPAPEPDPELLFQCLMLARTYSMIGELELAEIILSALMPEVARIKDGTEKFLGYLWYDLHHQRLQNLQQAVENLMLAYQTLSQSDKVWFNGEKMKNPWKSRSAKAVLESALSSGENTLISEALQKGW